MDRVSSQLLLSSVTDSLISAGFDAVGTLGIDHPSFEADNDEGERDDAMALDQPQPAYGKAAAAWADLCSILAKEAEVRLIEVAKKAKLAAELQGRTNVNAVDTVMALEYTGTPVSSLLKYTRAYADLEDRKPSEVVDRRPETTADMSEEFAEDPERKLYDEKHRQKRPEIVPNFMPQFPEPHTYMRTPVYFPPMTDYVEWRTKAAQLKAEQQDALIHFAASVTEPRPKPLILPGKEGKRANVPVISRPRASTPYYAYHMTERDWQSPGKRRGEKDPPIPTAAENPFLFKEPIAADADSSNPLEIDI
eukprot:m.455482 g.455482  ORF g.455482 m.455482 type:complete len:307 (+) comp20880_c0_seq1:186-1106(+)